MSRGALAVLGLALAAAWGSPAWPAEPPRFRLDFVEVDWVYLGPRSHAPFGVPLLSIDEGDVAAWDPSVQRLVLRPEVTPRFLAMAQKLPDLNDRIYKLRALWSNRDLWSILRDRGFVVSRDGHPVCRGLLVGDHQDTSVGDGIILRMDMDESRRIVLSAIPSTCGPLGELFASLGKPAEPPAVPRAKNVPERPPVLLAVEADARNAMDGWSLYFKADDEVAAHLAEIRYRLIGNSEWLTADLESAAQLGYVGAGPRRVDIEALDYAGELLGRYSGWIDLEDEAALHARDDRLLFDPPPEAIACQAKPGETPGETATGPITLFTSISDRGWSISFSFSTPAVREICYRFADDPEWHSTGQSTVVNLVTGDRFARKSVVLDAGRVALGRQRIDVKLIGWNGVESGPYAFWLDPRRATAKRARKSGQPEK